MSKNASPQIILMAELLTSVNKHRTRVLDRNRRDVNFPEELQKLQGASPLVYCEDHEA